MRGITGSIVTTILAGALLAAAGLARADIKDQSPSGFTIENSQVVPVDAMTAWQALVDDVGRWWPKDHTWWGDASKLSIQARAGGCFCEIDGPRQAAHMTVAFVDPGKILRMTGGLGPLQGMGFNGALEWRFAPAEGGTRITLYYRAGGYSPEDIGSFVPVIDRVQAAQLGGLADFLRRGAGHPDGP